MGEELNEEELYQCLLACLADAPGDKGQDAPPPSAVQRALRACFGGGGSQGVKATEEEIRLAAHYIIDRFGKSPKPKLDRLEAILKVCARVSVRLHRGL